MDYWPHLPPVRQLPFLYRAWAWWLRNGPKRAEQGTIGGSAAFRMLTRLERAMSGEEHRYLTLSAPERPRIVIDLRDFQSFHHSLPVWYRGDKQLEILRSVMTSGGTFLDVGANYGVYALALAQMPGVRVIAVEPEPRLAGALRSSRDANSFANLEIVEAALDKEVGTAQLAVTSASGTASLQRFTADTETIIVKTLTIDEIVKQFGIDDLRCVKVDVEGAEFRVFQGAHEALLRFHPVIIFEAGRDEPQNDVFAYLRNHGYDEFRDQASPHAPPRLDQPLTNVVATASARQQPVDMNRAGFPTNSPSEARLDR